METWNSLSKTTRIILVVVALIVLYFIFREASDWLTYQTKKVNVDNDNIPTV